MRCSTPRICWLINYFKYYPPVYACSYALYYEWCICVWACGFDTWVSIISIIGKEEVLSVVIYHHHCIFDFRLEMSGLVLEIGFEYDKAIQIHRWANSIWMFPISFQQYYSTVKIAPIKLGFEFPLRKSGNRVIIKMTMSNGLCISSNQSVSVSGN